MAESSVQDEISLISKGLYRRVSDVIRPECIVKLRQQRWNISDILLNCENWPELPVTSGSMSEGFEFKSSDLDKMYVDKNAFVCTRFNGLYLQGLKSYSLFCMDSDECSSGFTLLRCLTCDMNNELVYKCLDRRSNNMYLSSKAIRERFLSSSITETHGPCKSMNIVGIEHDSAYTLKCPVWPREATSFIARSLDSGWPSYDVLISICNDGCLFIPINSKQQTCSELIDLEWRISFSLAEKKLIHSMNHCQFLCYGLTKIFLNEVLKKCSPPINDLMCSYFMKTAVFWEISANAGDWSIQTFLPKFWNVFRRLIQWVRNGYCPNFFIPENNMFNGKICGENQKLLLSVLHDLYKDGYWCLLRCSSLNKELTTIITQHHIADFLSHEEEEYVSESEIERERLWSIYDFDIPITIHDREGILKILYNTVRLNTDSETMKCTVRLRLIHILQQYAQSLLILTKPPYRNRKQYLSRKAAQRILIRAKTYFCIDYLYYAKCTYMSGNYHKTIEVLHFIKHRLQSQPYMYWWSLDDDIIMAKRQQGMPYDTLIQSFIVSDVKMDSFTSMEELRLECHAEEKHRGSDDLYIPPLVFINFLLILSLTRIGNYHTRYYLLEDLKTLLCHDDGYHIPIGRTAISWEILGICQQICGDHQAAFQSYINVLNEKYNYLKEGTITRINNLYN